MAKCAKSNLRLGFSYVPKPSNTHPFCPPPTQEFAEKPKTDEALNAMKVDTTILGELLF